MKQVSPAVVTYYTKPKDRLDVIINSSADVSHHMVLSLDDGDKVSFYFAPDTASS